MFNQRVWFFNRNKHINDMYFFDLGFNEKNDFSYWFSLNKINQKDRTEEQNDEIWDYIQKSSKRSMLYRTYHSIDDYLLPATMYVTFEFDKTQILPHFFQINSGYLIMSQDFADVLLSCNLGKNKIIPIRFFDLINNEFIKNKTYYLLNITEQHQYFLPNKSDSSINLAFIDTNGIHHYSQPSNSFYNKAYVYSKKSLSCSVDLWHDPIIHNSLYISDKLKQALQEKEFDKLLDLWECNIE